MAVIRLTKNGGAKESGFALIGECSVASLMVDAGSPQVKHLWFQQNKQPEANSQSVTEHSMGHMWNLYTVPSVGD